MTEAILNSSFRKPGYPLNFLKRYAAWRKARRMDRALNHAARRLSALSPHLLADIGLTDASESRR